MPHRPWPRCCQAGYRRGWDAFDTHLENSAKHVVAALNCAFPGIDVSWRLPLGTDRRFALEVLNGPTAAQVRTVVEPAVPCPYELRRLVTGPGAAYLLLSDACTLCDDRRTLQETFYSRQGELDLDHIRKDERRWAKAELVAAYAGTDSVLLLNEKMHELRCVDPVMLDALVSEAAASVPA